MCWGGERPHTDVAEASVAEGFLRASVARPGLISWPCTWSNSLRFMAKLGGGGGGGEGGGGGKEGEDLREDSLGA